MDTRTALVALLATVPPGAVVVSSLGRTSEEVYRLRPDSTLFVDSMGDVTAVALGIAVGAPDVPVVAIDTDGSFLMNLSVLPVLAAQLPGHPNLLVTIVDNERYESAGGLPSRSVPIDWTMLFGSVGLTATVVRHADGFPSWPASAGWVIVASVINAAAPAAASKPLDGTESSYRVERLLADLRGRPRRRPARKS